MEPEFDLAPARFITRAAVCVCMCAGEGASAKSQIHCRHSAAHPAERRLRCDRVARTGHERGRRRLAPSPVHTTVIRRAAQPEERRRRFDPTASQDLTRLGQDEQLWPDGFPLPSQTAAHRSPIQARLLR